MAVIGRPAAATWLQCVRGFYTAPAKYQSAEVGFNRLNNASAAGEVDGAAEGVAKVARPDTPGDVL
jgi:hypothetical protein